MREHVGRILRRVGAVWLVGAVSVTLAPQSASAETEIGAPEFGVIYTSNAANGGDDLDCWRIHDAFLAAGWREDFFKTAMSGDHSKHPDHGTFTHGPNDNNTGAAGDAVDLLYVSGHGLERALLPINDSPDAHDAYSDSISPDTGCTNGSPWEVGVGWIERDVALRTGYNESRWDTDVEWLVLCACDQLSSRPSDTYPTPSPTNSMAKTWARTLIGGPNRMHGIFGYAGTAPGTVDVSIASDFSRRALDRFLGNQRVLDAWEGANAAFTNYDWAAVVHDANRDDYLHGAGPVTADGTYDGWFGIDYYSRRLDGRILDGRGGAAETVSSLDAASAPTSWAARPLEGLGSVVARLFAVPAAQAEPRATRTSGSDVDFIVEATPRGQDTRLAVRAARVATAGLESVLRPSATRAETLTARGPGVQPVHVRRSVQTSESVTVWSNGRSEYSCGRELATGPVGYSREEAVRRAKEFLLVHGELPRGALAAEVRAVTRTRLGFESDDEVTETVRYEVHFAQCDRGVHVEGEDMGITVSLDSQGVTRMTARWMALTDTPSPATVPVPVGAALQAAASGAREVLDVSGEQVVHAVDLVYHVPLDASAAEARPAWRIELDSGTAMFVDAADGEVIRR